MAGSLKFRGKTSQLSKDSLRLLGNALDKLGGKLRLPPDEFGAGKDQGQVIVHVMTHRRELLVQLRYLLRG